MNQLIFRGANVGVRSWFGDTPLLLAVRHGHLEIVKTVLSLLLKGTRQNMCVVQDMLPHALPLRHSRTYSHADGPS